MFSLRYSRDAKGIIGFNVAERYEWNPLFTSIKNYKLFLCNLTYCCFHAYLIYIELDDTAPKADRIRLICMGKGILGPDNISIEQNELPVFLTHPTPINVSVKPILTEIKDTTKAITRNMQTSSSLNNGDSGAAECCCVVS
jgi:hypothetical protein